MLPRTVAEARRARESNPEGGLWAGDVYKVVDVLREHRPDLVVLEMETVTTATLVMLLPDRHDTSLADAYARVVPGMVTPDPQAVPEWLPAGAGR